MKFGRAIITDFALLRASRDQPVPLNCSVKCLMLASSVVQFSTAVVILYCTFKKCRHGYCTVLYFTNKNTVLYCTVALPVQTNKTLPVLVCPSLSTESKHGRLLASGFGGERASGLDLLPPAPLPGTYSTAGSGYVLSSVTVFTVPPT